jgi:hypothetical protein
MSVDSPATPVNDRQTRIAWTAIVALSTVILVMMRGNDVLSDADTLWHIASGRLMVETGAWPQIDTMSHTHAGQPWIAKEWLSQVLLFAAYAAGGWNGVMLLSACGVAAAAAVVAWRLLATWPPLMTVLVVWLVVHALFGIATARPHTLALGVMAMFTLMLLAAAERDQSPPWLALPVMVLWANLHAAFTLGFVIAACVALDALLRAAPERRLRLVMLWGLFGLGCIAAACVHPYGWQSLLINIDMARGNESVPLINEWDPHPILQPMGLKIVVAVVLVAALAMDGLRANAARVLLGLFMLYLTLKHQRFIMMLAIVAPMLSRDALAALVERVLHGRGLFRADDPLRDPQWRAPIAIGGFAAILALPMAMEPPAPPRAIAPAAALAAIPADVRNLPGYNSYNFGGFLVLQGVPSFIDGRTDQLFTANFMGRYFGYTRRGEHAAFLAFIDGYRPRWALVAKGQDDMNAFEGSPLWRETFADEHAKVFIRVGERS